MLASRDHLLATHEEFRKLAQEHTQYEQRLEKLKLYVKDQMQAIERQYREHISRGQVA